MPAKDIYGDDVSVKEKKFIEVFKRYEAVIKGVVARCIYFAYNITAVWRVTVILQKPLFLMLFATLIPALIETAYIIVTQHSKHIKWINPSAIFFLLCALPSIWLLEIKLVSDRQNGRFFPWIVNTTTVSPDLVGAGEASASISELDWVTGLEQFLVFALILAKWIAPKGNLTDSELSELLIIFITNGADTAELLEIFDDDRSRNSAVLVSLVLIIWSWSLLQFAMELTSTKKFPFIAGDDTAEDKTNVEKFAEAEDGASPSANYGAGQAEQLYEEKCYNCFCFYNDIWAMVVTLLFQDAPFFMLRIFVLVNYRIITQLNLFFTCKNLFLMILHINRIRVIYQDDLEAWKGFKTKVLERQEQLLMRKNYQYQAYNYQYN